MKNSQTNRRKSPHMTVRLKTTLLSGAVLSMFFASAAQAQQQQPYQGQVGRTLSESKEWWPEPVRPPAGSPNVVWILLDDVGFGASSAFGGGISTPTFEA